MVFPPCTFFDEKNPAILAYFAVAVETWGSSVDRVRGTFLLLTLCESVIFTFEIAYFTCYYIVFRRLKRVFPFVRYIYFLFFKVRFRR